MWGLVAGLSACDFVFSVFDLRLGFVVSLEFGFRLSSFALYLMLTGVLGILVQLFCGVRSTVFVAPGFAGLCLVLILLVFDVYLMVLVIDCEFVCVGLY